MTYDSREIVAILDSCCAEFTFPMMDNGYVYLAASRMSGFYSEDDWALVVEIFGYSPRGGYPEINVLTFSSRIDNRSSRDQYVSDQAYENYLRFNPNNESTYFYPIQGQYQEENNDEFVAEDADGLILRGRSIQLPAFRTYAEYGINLIDSPRVRVFELCRYLADVYRETCLATEQERRVNVRRELKQIIQLEDWHHPDTASGELPSQSEAFQQLAEVLTKGDASKYDPTATANTHWKNWPDSGTL